MTSLLGLVAGLVSSTAPATALQCEVALIELRSVATRTHGKAIVVATKDDQTPPIYLEPKGLRDGWTRYENGKETAVDPPSPELIEEFSKTAMRNAVPECPAMQAWLRSNRIPFGSRAVKSVLRRANADDELPAGIYTVGLPVVDSSGTVALLYQSDVWGGEAAGGFVALYRRQAGAKWRLVTKRRLWIS